MSTNGCVEPESRCETTDIEAKLPKLRLSVAGASTACLDSLPLLSKSQASKVTSNVFEKRGFDRKQIFEFAKNANTLSQNAYPILKEMHKMEMQTQLLNEEYESMLKVRDRKWIKSAPIKSDLSVLERWRDQLKFFCSKNEEFSKEMAENGADLDGDRTVLCTEEPKFSQEEGLNFSTRYQGCDFSLNIRTKDDELLVESDPPLTGLQDTISICFQLGLPVDMMLWEHVWPKLDADDSESEETEDVTQESSSTNSDQSQCNGEMQEGDGSSQKSQNGTPV